MAYQYIEKSVQLEHGSHFSIKNSTGLCTRFPLYINSFIIKFYVT